LRDDISEQSGQQMGRGGVKKLKSCCPIVSDLSVAVIAIVQLISYTAS
jgi:hypothetical protein